MIYFVSDGSGFIKIGVANDMGERLKQLQTGNARELKVVKQIKTSGIQKIGRTHYSDYRLERVLHDYFRDYRISHDGKSTEWFSEKPVLRMLELNDDEILAFIKNLVVDCPEIEMEHIAEEKTYEKLLMSYELSQKRCEKYRQRISELDLKIKRLERENKRYSKLKKVLKGTEGV